jgi:hypothetical protein
LSPTVWHLHGSCPRHPSHCPDRGAVSPNPSRGG